MTDYVSGGYYILKAISRPTGVSETLAVLLHHLWVSGEVYEPLHNSRRTTVASAA